MITFVGAGPGAEDLITVRGQNKLKEADVVIYAGSLVNPALLKMCREECEIYNSAEMTLEEVMEVMIKGESSGKKVVRLHTGDPCLYGAIKEQMDELDRRKIPFEDCPGSQFFLWGGSSIESRIHSARYFPVSGYYKDGRKNTCTGKRINPKFRGTSGDHGIILKYRYVREAVRRTGCRRISGRNSGGDRV